MARLTASQKEKQKKLEMEPLKAPMTPATTHYHLALLSLLLLVLLMNKLLILETDMAMSRVHLRL